MMPSILIVAALDTKAEEARFVRDRLEADGHAVSVIDFSIQGEPAFPATISAEVVAAAGGVDRSVLQAQGARATGIDTMQRGAAAVVAELHRQGQVLGIFGMGGSGGTSVGTAAMRVLPLGIPKLMVSTVASGNTQPFVDIADITMVNSIVDFAGLNPISDVVLGNAAAALSGMVTARRRPLAAGSPSRLIAASMFGVTTPAVEQCRKLLGAAGYTLVPFHATGIGGRSMESLIAAGYFAGVLDLTTTEWADEVVGGTLSAGPDRLSAAASIGIPQVVAPGALDMVNFWGVGGVPERFAQRKIHRHSENSYLMRTTAAENTAIGRRIAERLNAAIGPLTLLFPLRGVSALDAEGAAFFDPDADAALLATFRSALRSPSVLETIDVHINAPAFAQRAVALLLAQLSHDQETSQNAQAYAR